MPHSKVAVSGSCIFPSAEGSRIILVEVQALVCQSFLPIPKRSAIGWDNNRLSMIIAILNARMGINIADKEIYLNIAGGLKILEPGIDLAVALALLSAHKNIKIRNDIVLCGEIGLSGEVRNVPTLENRLKEASKLGFTTAIIADTDKNFSNLNIFKIHHIRDLAQIINKVTA